jgi:hypothetical protein
MKRTLILPKATDASAWLQSVEVFLRKVTPGKHWQLTLEPYRRERSNQQNRYLRGVCAKLLSDHTGYEVDEVYEYLLGTYFGWRQERCPKTPSNPRGMRDLPIRSTTRNEDGEREVLKDREFWDFVEWIQRFGAQHGVMIPDPDPSYRREEVEERAA